MKTNQLNPSFMEKTEITSFYKEKSPIDELNSDRGIFKLNLIRSIKEKMIYNDIYKEIDMTMRTLIIHNSIVSI